MALYGQTGLPDYHALYIDNLCLILWWMVHLMYCYFSIMPDNTISSFIEMLWMSVGLARMMICIYCHNCNLLLLDRNQIRSSMKLGSIVCGQH